MKLFLTIKKILLFLPLCLLWTVWGGGWVGNRRTFEDVEYMLTQLLASFISSLYGWSFALGFTSNFV